MLYNEKNPHGGDVYGGDTVLDFSANTNPFGTPEGVKAAVSGCLDRLSAYPDPYCRRLVSRIAEHENVPKEYILCGAGAAELIYSYAFAEKPGKALELAPTFAEYSLPLTETRMERYFLREENGFRIGRDLLDLIEKNRPDTVFLCDPNNPTGLAAGPGMVEETASLCRALGTRLFLDECFMDLADEPNSFVPLLSKFPNVIILKAFTKSFGMAGLRLGYCLTADAELLALMSRVTQPWNVSAAAQEAGAAALSEMDFLEKTRALIREERKRMAGEIRRLGLTVFDSNVNFLLIKGRPGLDERLLEKGIRIRNCANFHGLYEGFYRIAVKLLDENDSLVKALKECL